ncbi:MAG: response regulator [Burkholderiaceae bacterium]|nr:response regulator [Burkholderiaceae bacterium]
MLNASEILNARILIVDDQEANVMLLEQMLANAGYLHITSTTDPRAVRALHAAAPFDLILLDLQMPDMDGFEVMAGLKEIDPNGYLPVLVITAQPGHKLRALQAGAKDFVSKPFDLVEVQTRIRNMLEVRLLYRKLADYNVILERTVRERTLELSESEARFKSFTELSSDWYWEQDAQGKFTKVSGPVFDMLGIEAGAGAGADAGGNPASRWNAAERALLDANIAERKPFLDFVYSRGNADGTTQYLQVSGEPMFDAASRFIGYRGIGMDITERMRPNREQQRLRGALDAIGAGLCLIERAGGRLVDANATLCRLLGYSRQELLAADPAQLGFGDLSAGLDAPGPRQAAVLLRKDGSSVAVDIDWSASEDGAVLTGVIGT